MENYDMAIVGGGILGSSVAYWLSELFDARIVILEKNPEVGMASSSRNTGVLHRPFYLDPARRKKFAVAANLGYQMWREIASIEQLPWKPYGTIELATKPDQLATLKNYVRWGIDNGMEESELELLETPRQVEKEEPHVRSEGALVCKTDTSVNFDSFTRYMERHAQQNGVKFLMERKVTDVDYKNGGVRIHVESDDDINASLLINCAGGDAVDIAHKCDLGLEYTDLHFRGDYWTINPDFGRLFKHNVYTVPEHMKFQFLDPHLIIRADGRHEIGPNAVPVAGPENYHSIGWLDFPSKLLERPVANKAKLLANPEFLRLAFNELAYLSKGGMVRRMKSFIPSLESRHIAGRGNSGIRHSLISPDGSFIPETVELADQLSYHVLNYNSPGASGSIAYAAYVVNDLINRRLTGNFRRFVSQRSSLFDFDEVVSRFKI